MDGVDQLLEDEPRALILVVIAEVFFEGVQQIDLWGEQVDDGFGSVGDFLLEVGPV